MTLSINKLTQISLRWDDAFIIVFWVRRMGEVPILSRISINVFLTPASYSSSERNVNIMKAILNTERSRLKDEIIEALSDVSDLLKPFVYHTSFCENE